MKTIKNEIKAKYFALYYGLPVIRWHQWNNEVPNGRVTMNIPMQGGNFTVDEGWYLELKPLSSISDEDAILIGYLHKENFMAVYKYGDIHPVDIDILRQLGYATDFTTIVDVEQVTYSVSDLVELNVIKLKK